MRVILVALLLLCVFGYCSAQIRRITIENYVGDISSFSTSATVKDLSRNKKLKKKTFIGIVPQDESVHDRVPIIPTDSPVLLPSKSRTVLLHNNYENNSIAVYWVDTTSSSNAVRMGEVNPLGFLNATTYPGHSFFAVILPTKDNGGEDIPSLSVQDEELKGPRASPPLVNILNTIYEYDFGPKYFPRTSLHPAITELHTAVTNVRFKVKSLVSPSMSVWGDNGYSDNDAQLIVGAVPVGKEEYINTFEGAKFFFTPTGNKNKVLFRTTVTKNHSLIAVEEKGNPPSKALKTGTAKQLKFHKEYLKTNGIPWNQYYDCEKHIPRPPVSLYMWPANRVGDVHRLHSKEGFWNCKGTAAKCQSLSPVPLNIEVVSTAPRVFIIKNFISPYEMDEVKRLAKPQLRESFIGSGKFETQRRSESRTSSNTWVERRSGSPVTESLFLRAADLTQVPEFMLHKHTYAEELQVVHYDRSEKYDGHYDWANSGYPETRYITVLLYLTNQSDADAGGETSFPKANGGKGLKIHPGAGSAVMFYNLLPDGNGDELTYHAALPVLKGEKWLANFWVWDPKFH